MSPSETGTPRRWPRRWPRLAAPRIVRRFTRDAKGTTAVEFAILAMPFFVLLFGIIECSLIFFAGQMLESSVDDVGRRIRTGQLDNTLTESQFKTEMCNASALLFECSKIKLDMRVASRFDTLPNPPTPNGTTNAADFSGYKYSAPCPGEIVMVTASYEWPIFTYFTADNIHPQSRGQNNSAFRKILLNAIAVFRTEPYPAATGGRSC